MDYCPPDNIRINPCTLEIVAETPVNVADKYNINFCVGKQLSEDIVIPRVCIDLNDSASCEYLQKQDKIINLHKQANPYMRYGICTFRQGLNLQLIEEDIKNIDFIEALGTVIDYPDKLEHHLNDLIIEQVSICETLLRKMYDNGNIRSIRKNLIY